MAHFSWFFRIKIELHFSLIAAAVTYIMWKNVGNDKIQKMEGKKFPKEVDQVDSKKRRYWRVDCQSASKGLFLGKVTLEIKNGILLTKLFWPTVRKNCFSDREKLLKFVAEGREFAKFLRSLEQFIQTVKGQNNFW